MGTLPIAFETAGDTLKEMEEGRLDAKASRIDATTKVNDVLRLQSADRRGVHPARAALRGGRTLGLSC
jgi:hypothetical protein